jgi:hypothetical protein
MEPWGAHRLSAAAVPPEWPDGQASHWSASLRPGQEGIQTRVVEMQVSDQRREQVLLGSKGGFGILIVGDSHNRLFAFPVM